MRIDEDLNNTNRNVHRKRTEIFRTRMEFLKFRRSGDTKTTQVKLFTSRATVSTTRAVCRNVEHEMAATLANCEHARQS